MQIILSTIAFLIVVAAPVFAGVRVEKVVAGLDGYIRGERWIPVIFRLQGTGPGFQGSIEVARGKTVFRKSIDLGAGTAKRIELLVYQTNFYEPLTYELLDAAGKVAVKDTIHTRVLNYQDNIVLVISSTDFNHQFVNGVQNPWGGKTFVSYMKPEDAFIESIAYSATDSVALGNISMPELSPTVRKALLMYAATGGTLVFSPTTNLSVLQDPAIRPVLPSLSAEFRLLSHGEFLVSRWSAKSTEPFPAVTFAVQELRGGPADNILVTHTPDLGLATSSPFFKGNIVYFAFDYTRMPEVFDTIFPGYWNDLIYPSASGPPAFGRNFRQRLEDNPRAQRFLYDIPGLKLPDVKWFALFFFVYLMSVGPLQYLILTRLKKNALLWTTFPLIILIFTGAAIGYSKVRRSSDQRIRQVQVIDSFPALGMQYRYQSFGTALSDSGKFSYQAVPENSFMTKAARQAFNYLPEPFVLSEDLPRSIVGENVKAWTYRTYDAISAEAGSLPIELTVRIDGSRLTGEVKNFGDSTVQNSFFAYDSKNSALVGSLEPNSSRTFAVELNNTTPPPFADIHLKGLLGLGSPSLSQPHFFFGEVPGTGEIVINGKSRATDSIQYLAVYLNLEQAGPNNVWVPETNPMPYR